MGCVKETGFAGEGFSYIQIPNHQDQQSTKGKNGSNLLLEYQEAVCTPDDLSQPHHHLIHTIQFAHYD